MQVTARDAPAVRERTPKAAQAPRHYAPGPPPDREDRTTRARLAKPRATPNDFQRSEPMVNPWDATAPDAPTTPWTPYAPHWRPPPPPTTSDRYELVPQCTEDQCWSDAKERYRACIESAPLEFCFAAHLAPYVERERGAARP